VSRHQLPPGLLDGQTTVTTLSYFPVTPVLRGQAGHPKHAECVQPHLQLVGLCDFLGGQRRGSVFHTLGTQPWLWEVCVHVCLGWEAACSTDISEDTEPWGQGLEFQGNGHC
jgi:hypothetical protein